MPRCVALEVTPTGPDKIPRYLTPPTRSQHFHKRCCNRAASVMLHLFARHDRKSGTRNPLTTQKGKRHNTLWPGMFCDPVHSESETTNPGIAPAASPAILRSCYTPPLPARQYATTSSSSSRASRLLVPSAARRPGVHRPALRARVYVPTDSFVSSD